MGDEEAFLAALAERPGDDLTRLVFADWLEERDDGRAAYLRLVVDVAARIKTNRPHRRPVARVGHLAEGIALSWREVAGKRFSLRLDSFDPAYKITTIACVRTIAVMGLWETKCLVESAPVIVLEQLLLEDADRFRHQLEFGYWDGSWQQTGRFLPVEKCCRVSILNCVR